MFVAYANTTEYGVKFLKSSEERHFTDEESWEKNWEGLVAVACSYQWFAVANEQEVKVLDVIGN